MSVTSRTYSISNTYISQITVVGRFYTNTNMTRITSIQVKTKKAIKDGNVLNISVKIGGSEWYGDSNMGDSGYDIAAGTYTLTPINSYYEIYNSVIPSLSLYYEIPRFIVDVDSGQSDYYTTGTYNVSNFSFCDIENCPTSFTASQVSLTGKSSYSTTCTPNKTSSDCRIVYYLPPTSDIIVDDEDDDIVLTEDELFFSSSSNGGKGSGSKTWSDWLDYFSYSTDTSTTVTIYAEVYYGDDWYKNLSSTLTISINLSLPTALSIPTVSVNSASNFTVTATPNVINSNLDIDYKINYNTWNNVDTISNGQKFTCSKSYQTWLFGIGSSATSSTGSVTAVCWYGEQKLKTLSQNFTIQLVNTNNWLSPTINTRVISDTNTTSKNLGIYVQNKSTIQAALSSLSVAYSSYNNATIKSYSFALGGSSKSATASSKTVSSATLGTITPTVSGTVNYTITITDSRNYSRSYTGSINVYKYLAPKLVGFDYERYLNYDTSANTGIKSPLGKYIVTKTIFETYPAYSGLSNTINVTRTNTTKNTSKSSSASITKSGNYARIVNLHTDNAITPSEEGTITVQVTDNFGATASYTYNIPKLYNLKSTTKPMIHINGEEE